MPRILSCCLPLQDLQKTSGSEWNPPWGRAERAEAPLKSKSCSRFFSRVCESDFPSTCWANRIAVKYFLWVTHKSVGGDEAPRELDDVLNNDLLFSSWPAALARRAGNTSCILRLCKSREPGNVLLLALLLSGLQQAARWDLGCTKKKKKIREKIAGV